MTFRQTLIQQLEALKKFEITEYYNDVEVWDTVDETMTTYKFDDNGNLVDIY